MFDALYLEDVPKLRRTDVKYTLQLLLRVVRHRAPHPATRAAAQPAAGNSVKIGFLGQQIILSGVSRVTSHVPAAYVTCHVSRAPRAADLLRGQSDHRVALHSGHHQVRPAAQHRYIL